MTDKERIEQIDIIIKKVKEYGHFYHTNVYDNESIGVIYYNDSDIKNLKKLKRNLLAFRNFKIKTNMVIGNFKDNRPEKDKPQKNKLKYIDINEII